MNARYLDAEFELPMPAGEMDAFLDLMHEQHYRPARRTSMGGSRVRITFGYQPPLSRILRRKGAKKGFDHDELARVFNSRGKPVGWDVITGGATPLNL